MKGLERLRPLLRSYVETGPPGCALSVMYQGENVFEEFVGLADVDAKKVISSDTIYRIYSMTKVVTCTAALMLYERGLFLLNDPIEEYLPEFKDSQVYRLDNAGNYDIVPATRPILVKDLFTMTSGITYGGDGDQTERDVRELMTELEGGGKTARDLSKAIANIPLAFVPGSQWRYGFSHDVLGALIEVVSGKTLGEFLEEEIFEPLGMRDTSFRLPEEKKGRLCSLYNRNEAGELIQNTGMDRHYQSDTLFESGGAGLLSTIGDYSRFAHVMANGGSWDDYQILGSKTVGLMSMNHLQEAQMVSFNWPYLAGYGYGLGVRTMVHPQVAGSNSSVGEFGWSGLAGTWVLIDPKEKLSAVYMQQMMPNLEEYHQPRLRNVICGTVGTGSSRRQ
ncbi:beta-lactamase family protein [Bacillus tamaricis]|uniref:Beta-lactamase family protein n=2 Tax=Evansella tamaricis TaxID=2069301 RepID=A0ABS6JHV6_9BACI|nr:serine hydrolase domain-containing protein [Evansella tamaricis]MBU9713218.1 beta-lactamase family protein [Evansella tamaricis]